MLPYFMYCCHGGLDCLQGYREEIDGLQEELNVVQNLGAELMTACGEPDKPVIKKSIDEVTSDKLFEEAYSAVKVFDFFCFCVNLQTKLLQK